MGFRESPYGNYNFQVNLGGEEPAEVVAGFTEVVLPEARIDVIEYRQGNYKDLSTMKLPGRVHYGNLVLRRGAMGLANLYEWWDQVRKGTADAPRDVSITLLQEDHQTVVMTWQFVRAWPVSIKYSKLKAQGETVLVEKLELAFDRMDINFD
jgi:phage tail-like protein